MGLGSPVKAQWEMEETESRKGRGCPRARSTPSRNPRNRKGRRGKGEPGAPDRRPPRPHQGPRRDDRPQVSSGGAAHRDGGRAGSGPAEQAAPRRVLGPAPLPGSRRVKRGDEGGPGSGPHPSQPGGATTDTAGGSTLPQHTSPDLHPPPPFAPLAPQFPDPRPSAPLPRATVHHTGRQPSRHLPPRLLLPLPPSAPC
ncbi:uncharacterized protein LOC115287882 [Suricata suricatta]|uniref:uncharacterized protein LOC115287882 n=1 Tax=Suricata suricatta TaxID=37032 RepID=UPI001155EC4E|nr:uncharacterized protein LOC115287882 [Suricata suricatta]